MRNLAEEDIRPDYLMEKKKSALEADKLFLLQRKDEWTSIPCPVCGEDAHTIFGEKDSCSFVRCSACSMVYMSPRPSVELLHAYYEQSQNYAFWAKFIFPATQEVRYERIHKPRALRLVEQCVALGIKGGSFLEIGAGYGDFCRAVQEMDFFQKVTALEPTVNLAQICREKGLPTVESTLEHYASSEKFDVIAAYEVIEHIHDPKIFLTRCARLLNPRGIIILSFPNVEGFDVRVLGAKAPCFQYGHLNYFAQSTISYLLFKIGFSVLALNTPGELDISIVRKRMHDSNLSMGRHHFMQYLFEELPEEAAHLLQNFIKEINAVRLSCQG